MKLKNQGTFAIRLKKKRNSSTEARNVELEKTQKEKQSNLSAVEDYQHE